MKRPSNSSSGNLSRTSSGDRFPAVRGTGERGAALVVVLGFVVMLLALLMAYFSRGVLQRRISDASSNLAMEDLLGRAAVDAVVSDFRQEIAQGSVQGGYPVYTNSATGEVTRIYIPVTNRAATPFISPSAITNITGSGTNATNGLENVVKISSSASPYIFPASTNPYDNAAAVPKRVAAGDYTTNPSANGRSVSPARWNKPLLIARNNPSDDKDVTPASSFIAPEWILVNRAGSNPVAWSRDLVWNPTNPTTVVGRYSYIIYNEGGLLDATVAGYPPALTNAVTNPYVPYKGVLGFADLTQIGLNPVQINALVGWRNVASAGSVGSYPSYSFPGGVTNYGKTLISDTNGGMKVYASGSLTDRRFTGRQQLIDFLINSDPNNRSASMNALQYLGTFGRDVSQPSLAPPQGTNPTAPGYQTGYPDRTLIPPSQGGNREYTNKAVNPPFPSVRVINTFARLDGTPAIPGEPLVKKRFPLNRLAWITYKGPSAQHMTDPSLQQTIRQMGGDPFNQNDPITHFVAQGSASNIVSAFGLVWNPAGYWSYTHTGALPSTTPILTLAQVAAQNREPDFFELLKAGINAGSIAKPASDTNGSVIPLNNQSAIDSSGNYAVIQLGANIIDQFDSDGYPTVIRYNYFSNSGVVSGEFRGVENLPYLYRVHPVAMTAINPTLTNPNAADITEFATSLLSYKKYWAGAMAATVANSGLGVVMLVPEIWNPHDWNATNLTQTFGLQGNYPTNFRVCSISTSSYRLIAQEDSQYSSDLIDTSKTRGYTDWGFPAAGEFRTLSNNNTEMKFVIPANVQGAQLFREPTVLCRPGYPTGSALYSPAMSNSVATLDTLATNTFITKSRGGIVAKMGITNAPGAENSSGINGPPIVDRSYIGMYLGSIPLIWRDTHNLLPRAMYVRSTSAFDVYTFLQYQDPVNPANWVTYDTKSYRIGEPGFGGFQSAQNAPLQRLGIFANIQFSSWCGFLEPFYENDTQYFAIDPRTPRFGMQVFSGGNLASGGVVSGAAPTLVTTGGGSPPFAVSFANVNANGYSAWINRDEGIMGSTRDGWSPGGPLNGLWSNAATPGVFPSAFGFYPGNTGANDIRPGLFSQNAPSSLSTSGRLNGDGEPIGTNATAIGAQYYADPDRIVRRAMGGWSDIPTTGKSGINSFNQNNYAELLGLPMRRAHQWSTNASMLVKTDVLGGLNNSLPLQSESRPMILNRPFHSVAELGYTFSGTPWKNLNFEMPESGDSGLLDIFCIQDSSDPSGLVAGKVDLNTRQRPVLKAILAGAYKDEMGLQTNAISTNANALADILASRLVARTTGITNGVTLSSPYTGPLANLSDLVGRWIAPKPITGITPTLYAPSSFDGFSADLFNPANFLTPTVNTTPDTKDDPANPSAILEDKTIGRRRAAPIRALAAVGETRVWNLMIDLVVQRGKYPASATGFDRFMVEGEARYWVHLAIDRLTGQVIDQQTEVVKE